MTSATNLQNPAEYAQLAETWTIPAWPSNPADINYELLFNGIGGNGVLLQPEVRAHPANWSDWIMISEATNKPNCTNPNCFDDQVVWSSNVQAGHQVIGWMWMSSKGGGGETWQIYTEDVTTGDYAILTETLSGFAPFNAAYFGALEVHGLTACDGLPDSTGTWFSMDTGSGSTGGVFQAGNSGDPPNYVNVTSEQQWYGYTASGTSPSCSWVANTSDTPTYIWLGYSP